MSKSTASSGSGSSNFALAAVGLAGLGFGYALSRYGGALWRKWFAPPSVNEQLLGADMGKWFCEVNDQWKGACHTCVFVSVQFFVFCFISLTVAVVIV